jgi:hypothetical protein
MRIELLFYALLSVAIFLQRCIPAIADFLGCRASLAMTATLQ